MSRQFLFLLFSGILLITGCTSTTEKPFKDQTAKARQLMNSGNPEAAAQIYQQLADTESPYRNQFRLLAADAFLQSSNINQAKKYIDEIELNKLPQQQRDHYNLLAAQINLSLGSAEKAIIHLDAITFGKLNSNDRKTYHQSRAFAYSLIDKPLHSARERVHLSRYLNSPQQIDNNNNAIYASLSLLSVETLISKQPPPPDILGGWMALTRILKSRNQQPGEFAAEISAWRRTYPGHPALPDFLNAHLGHTAQQFITPSSIAILLPETGPYAQAAKAIREGFLAAHHYQEDSAYHPDMRFYNAEASDLSLIYQQAKKNGAELIIGPLNKKNIARLVATTKLDIPVLALNYIPELNQNNLYQFGLNPIDDVQQATSKASLDGHQKALILVPETELGQRIGDYYATNWQVNDNVTLETQTYDPKAHDFSVPIKRLLNLDESAQRQQNIRKLIPGIHYTPRRRHDVDAIFLHATPNTARLLNPQLQFYRASRVPVYATHYLFSGKPNPTQDIDLNGIVFCDIPWLFTDAYQGGLSLENQPQLTQQFSATYIRLIALGIDAYNVVPQLGKLTSTTYPGTTGNLSLTEKSRIKRNLICAKFNDGMPISQGFLDNTGDYMNTEIEDQSIIDVE